MAGDPRNILLDVGALWVAPVGTTAPTGNATVQPSPIAGFRQTGYTESGTKFLYTPKYVPIDVEEEIDTLRWVLASRQTAVEIEYDEAHRTNLAMVLNLGASLVNDNTKLSPPVPGADQRVFLMWESALTGARWLYYQAVQTGVVTVERRKAPNKTKFMGHWELEKPLGLPAFDIWPSNVGAAGAIGSLV